MKTVQLAVLVALTTLVGCGGDSGGSPRRPSRNNPEVTIPGLEGENQQIPSQGHRDRGFRILPSLEAIPFMQENPTSTRYRSIPDIATDDEGSKNNVITLETRPKETCGQGEGLSLTERKTNCATRNNKLKNFLWSATASGAAGEADWALVSRNSAGFEIWQDYRTGMVWSDIISSGANWCNAAGNAEEVCREMKGTSLCLGKIGGLDNVTWRLPTRNEFMQADLDGLRFVLKISESETDFWTATLDSASIARDKAWVYRVTQGTLTSASFSNAKAVRCIGVSVL